MSQQLRSSKSFDRKRADDRAGKKKKHLPGRNIGRTRKLVRTLTPAAAKQAKLDKERALERIANGKKVTKTLFEKVRAIAQKKSAKVEDAKRPQTVKELYANISVRSHILKVYVEVMQLPGGKPPEKILIKDYIFLFKRLGLEIYEKDIKDSFYYLAKETAPELRAAKEREKEKEKERDKDKEKSKFGEDKWEEKLFLLPSELGRMYDEYVAEEENLKGVLNVHMLKTRNYELQVKLSYWKSTEDKRKELDGSYEKKEKFILGKLKEFAESTMLEKEELDRRASSFYDLLENKRNLQWELKILMKFLSGIPTAGVIALTDMKRYLENTAIQKAANFSLLKSLIDRVKKECALHGKFFSFYDVPDVIIKLKYSKREYDLVMQFLNRTKEAYLAFKRQKTEGQTEPVQITDDDLVPLAILDDTLAQMRYKQDHREEFVNKVIFECEAELGAKKQKLDVTNDRIMQTIENNIFIIFVNGYPERMLTDYNLCLFVVKQIYKWLHDGNFVFKVNDFLTRFRTIMGTDKANPEFAKLNTAELDRFNKRTKVSDSESDVSTSMIASRPQKDGGSRSPSKRLNSKPSMDSSGVSDEVADAIDVLNQFDPNRSGENKRPPPPLDSGKLETVVEASPEKAEEGLLSLRSEEGKKALTAEEAAEKERYKTNQGYYNPKEKFGTLEKDYTEYEPHMTKYEAVLPVDHYMKTINDQTPEKQPKWFLRSHHLETLTRNIGEISRITIGHPFSKQDNVMNTKYYSYYNQEKPTEPANKGQEMEKMTGELVSTLEEQLTKLKAQAYLNDQLGLHKTELGMAGKSLSLRSGNEKDSMGKIQQSVEEIHKYQTDKIHRDVGCSMTRSCRSTRRRSPCPPMSRYCTT